MSDESPAPEAEGTANESPEWVTGEGGPQFSESGMYPGGSEMENWKKPDPGQPNETSLEEQAETLRDRVEGS